MRLSPAGELELGAIEISLDAAERTWGRTHEMVMLGRALLARVIELESTPYPSSDAESIAAFLNAPPSRERMLKFFADYGMGDQTEWWVNAYMAEFASCPAEGKSELPGE